mmetsp:Transcript_10203/g.21492  ORF Transcript_10203/g.21492 Transcript_10203/m.21492 type:complete len:333 (-) Transcript_10203:171-1169(-)|eukprot:CAMPEP_0183308034 /NCGR_PEP_ID=MMETSP0160_2-20130417/19705_1 /TAXON_ID=2839 ORGANISM="Odontella Sinensis, Strain Grunow 1884" /NCGR_SAMPLE_ID=MMETSP0160_2 /ASSEMBLY_ACC=CAM_ASM_000250 /LENGTH=332 /DNA_ID=CAMNT_0025471777 /DNA_START=61 /DNA_END=1059 /DNA_ORIENTATION=-
MVFVVLLSVSAIGHAAAVAAPGELAVPSGLSGQNLLLDSRIRDWVVLPLLVIMISAGLLRTYIGQLLRAKSRKVPLVEKRGKSDLQRASRLRTGGGGYITAAKWEARRRYHSDKDGGFLREEAVRVEEEKERGDGDGDGGSDPMDALNPMAAMEGMKGNMVFMVQNMVMMQGISHFFRGFVLVKVPFPLTNGFKQMFQRGLDLTTLETSYVSSVSWYFLVMFGLRAFFRLAIGDPTPEVMEDAAALADLGRAQGSAPVGPQQFDAPKTLRVEADNLELVRQRPTVDDAERRLLGKQFPKRKALGGSSGRRNPGEDIFGYGAASGKGRKGKKA